MTNTIAGTYTTLVTLGAAIDNPTTISRAGLLTGGLQVTYAGLAVDNAGIVTGSGIRNEGMEFAAGGSVTNQLGGVISGYDGVLGQNAAVFVVNAGSIAGSGGFGVSLLAGGGITNQSGGAISGSVAIFAPVDAVTVVNAGRIQGYSTGIELAQVGSVTNQSGGTISATNYGVRGAATVLNAGSITGATLDGVYLLGGGSVTNQSGGAISGGRYGVVASTVVNAGAITGSQFTGVALYRGGGSVTNQIGGAISGAVYGIYGFYGALTVVNAGTVSGGSDAVHFAAGYVNRLVIDPGAVFSGEVTGGNTIGSATVSTLELASTGSAGTLTGLGTQYVDFAQVTLDAGAQWTLTGGNTLGSGATITNAGTLTLSDATLAGAAGLINNGAIILDPSSMTIGSLVGSGSVTIEAGSTLDVTGVIASSETIVFAGSGAYLHVGDPSSDAGAVINLGLGETIDLTGISPGSVSYSAGEVSFAGGSFALTTTNGSPLQVTQSVDGTALSVACFARGTRIATPSGSTSVEVLREGDLVCTASGGMRSVRWVGSRTIDLAGHPAPAQAQPIRIATGAFADDVPSRDLRLSPDHAVLLDGVLVPAKLLRNGVSITRDITYRRVTYYHIELDVHDILLAEGLAAESYLDTGNRGMFANLGLPLLPHPWLENDQMRRQGESCAPFVADPRRVQPMWQRLAARAGVVCDAADTAGDPGLHVVAAGRAIQPLNRIGGRSVFLLPARAGLVRLVSRCVVPHEHWPWIDEHRQLGVGVVRLTVRSGDDVETIPLDHAGLVSGWWDAERPDQQMWRWTTGNATVLLGNTGPVILEVDVAHVLADYPADPPIRAVTMAA